MNLSPKTMKAIRALKGLTQSDVANALGKSQCWYWAVENGRWLPTPQEAMAIERFLCDKQTVALLEEFSGQVVRAAG